MRCAAGGQESSSAWCWLDLRDQLQALILIPAILPNAAGSSHCMSDFLSEPEVRLHWTDGPAGRSLALSPHSSPKLIGTIESSLADLVPDCRWRPRYSLPRNAAHHRPGILPTWAYTAQVDEAARDSRLFGLTFLRGGSWIICSCEPITPHMVSKTYD